MIKTNYLTIVLLFISNSVSSSSWTSPWTCHDSLVILPSNPTVSDSIYFTRIMPHPCCCVMANETTSYDSTKISKLGDTAILLYNVNEFWCPTSIACDFCNSCFYMNYKLPPMKQGKYTIYKTDIISQIFCYSGTVPTCTTIVWLPDTAEIGKLNVSTTSIIKKPELLQTLKSDKKEYLYDLRGRLISTSGIINSKCMPRIYFIKNENNIIKKINSK
jgi:hypothetical protein